jgi:starch synthase
MSRRFRRLPPPPAAPTQDLRALFISAEVAPYTGEGGAAEMLARLPKALKPLGIEPIVVTPKPRQIDPGASHLAKRLTKVEVKFGQGHESAEVWEGRLSGGARLFFIDHPGLFHRDALYGDYDDDPARFAFLSLAALDLVKKLGLRPDIIHLNDWPTALCAAFLKLKRDAFFDRTKSVLTIHDIRYQGVFPKQWVEWLGLGWEGFHIGGYEFYDQLNFLKGGVAYADALAAVSPRYAAEIKTPERGFKLDGILRHRAQDLFGVLSGLDYEVWDPKGDHYLAQNFGPGDFHGRRRCKAELQRLFRLPIRENRPVLGVVAKPDPASGIELVAAAFPRLLSMGFQIVLLLEGGGPREFFEKMLLEHPDLVGLKIGPDEITERKLFGGADFILVPSLYCPAGDTQLKALRYGAVPICAATGGLIDTVEESDAARGQGTGFLFEPGSEPALGAALERATAAYADNRTFRTIQQRGMTKDYSWHRTARAYRDLYYRLLGRPLPAEPEPNQQGEVLSLLGPCGSEGRR